MASGAGGAGVVFSRDYDGDMRVEQRLVVGSRDFENRRCLHSFFAGIMQRMTILNGANAGEMCSRERSGGETGVAAEMAAK